MKEFKFLDQGQSGTTGIVYRAEDELGQEVAVKFFTTPMGPLRECVSAHAKAVAAVQHPNVVRIYGIEEVVRPNNIADSAPEHAIVMEYVPGQKFSDWLNKRDLTRSEAASVIRGLLEGLAAFHSAKRAHGDLHSGNVRVFNGVAKIIDPVAHEPNNVLSTEGFEQKKLHDLGAARRLVIDALRAANADTQAFGEFCILRTEIASIPLLIEKVELALRNPLVDGTGPAPLISFYDFCRASQKAQTIVPWQEATKAALRSFQPALNECRRPQHRFPTDFDQLAAFVAELLNASGDLLSLILSAAESNEPSYHSALTLLRRVSAMEWERSGDTRLVGVPGALLMCFHHFAGAAACFNNLIAVSTGIGTIRIQERQTNQRSPIWRLLECTGFGDLFQSNCEISWKFLLRAFGLLPVLRQVFPDELSYRVSLAAYNWLLAMIEFVNQDPLGILKIVKAGSRNRLYERAVPPLFLKLSSTEVGAAYQLLFDDNKTLKVISGIGRFNVEDILSCWEHWMQESLSFWAREPFGFRDLPRFIFSPPEVRE